MTFAIALAVFSASAGAVWLAGTRLSRYADEISRRTGIGQALIGLFLLAGVTSLPEIAVSVSAAAIGDAALAVNNLFGSIAMQVAILAVVDFMIGRRALTAVAPDSTLLLLGTLNILMLALATAGMVVGDVPFLGAGVWTWASLCTYVFCLWMLSATSARKPWMPAGIGRQDVGLNEPAHAGTEAKADGDIAATGLPAGLVLRTAAAGAVILVAGYALAQSGSLIAEETGLGSSFVGFVLLAISTSLPELSTALAAARRGLYTMAISDILGTNLINIGLLFVVDVVASDGPIFNAVDSFAVIGAVLGIIVTTLFLIGLAERRDKTVFRLGIDSVAVMIVYLGGLAILYSHR